MCYNCCCECKKMFFEFLSRHDSSSGAAIHLEEKKRDFAPLNFWRGFKMVTFTLISTQNIAHVHRNIIDAETTTCTYFSRCICVLNPLCTEMWLCGNFNLYKQHNIKQY